jgi:4-amino-4-deoxy-L-arabinose transferase-like glycosyltransferase
MRQETQQPRPLVQRTTKPTTRAIGHHISAVRPLWLLAGLVLLGIALRVWFISINPIDPSSSTADDGDYFRRALRFAVSGQYIDDSWLIRPPLHVFFFAAWLRIGLMFGSVTLGTLLIQLAQTALSALNIVLGYAIARRLFRSEWAGLLFALFLALWFPFVEQPSLLFSELLYSTLFLTHFWLLLRFDATGRKRHLALSGLALGAAALTRSPALYSLAFVGLWLLMRRPAADERQPIHLLRDPRHWWQTLRLSLVVALCCLAVVLPWTARNYIVYQRIIPVDTLGQINMWLDLDEVSQRNVHIEELRKLPQADRQAYATARVREILAEDPLRPFRNVWPTFRHIWKAQFVEDYFLKESFYDRPLRQAAPLGLLGDLLWLVFTAAGLVGLVSRPREGWHNRVFVLAWIGYTLFTVLIFHVEPRYLLPLWMLIALYGAGTLGRLGTHSQRPTTDDHPHTRSSALSVIDRRPSVVGQVVVLLAFAALLLTYRDYPTIISRGWAREQMMRAGDRAFARNDYQAAEQAFRAADAAQPRYLDSKVELALALLAQGRKDEAAAVVEGVKLRRAALVGELAREGSGEEKATALNNAEATVGLDVQRWAMQWLRPTPQREVWLGDGRDLGYIEGFSAAESSSNGSFRWLTGKGTIFLPLPEPIQPGATVTLRIAGPQPTPVTVTIGGQTTTFTIIPGQWRSYLLPTPEKLAGQRALAIELRAPTFIPAYQNSSSSDLRQLSVMISAAWVR